MLLDDRALQTGAVPVVYVDPQSRWIRWLERSSKHYASHWQVERG